MVQKNMNDVKMQFVNDMASAVTRYTESVMEIVRSMSVADLASENSPLSTSRPQQARPVQQRPSVAPAAPHGPFPGRPVRDPGKLVERILTVLSTHKDGLNTHLLRDAVNAAQSDFAKAVANAIAEGKILKTGQKRGTVYYLVDAAPKSVANPQNSTVAA